MTLTLILAGILSTLNVSAVSHAYQQETYTDATGLHICTGHLDFRFDLAGARIVADGCVNDVVFKGGFE